MPISAGGDGGAGDGRECCKDVVCGSPGYSKGTIHWVPCPTWKAR